MKAARSEKTTVCCVLQKTCENSTSFHVGLFTSALYEQVTMEALNLRYKKQTVAMEDQTLVGLKIKFRLQTENSFLFNIKHLQMSGHI